MFHKQGLQPTVEWLYYDYLDAFNNSLRKKATPQCLHPSDIPTVKFLLDLCVHVASLPVNRYIIHSITYIHTYIHTCIQHTCTYIHTYIHSLTDE